MAFFKFEVDGIATVENTPKGNKGLIKDIKISSDTRDQDFYERATSIIVKIEVTIRIESATKEACQKLMDWALTVEGDNVYKTVNISVRNENEDIRTLSFPNMYCHDYSENYSLNDKGNSTDYLTLCMIQQRGFSEDITNS